jgi:hypothetical protein
MVYQSQVQRSTSTIPAIWEVEIGGLWFEVSSGKIVRHYLKITKAKRGWGHGSSKVLSSNSNITKKYPKKQLNESPKTHIS